MNEISDSPSVQPKKIQKTNSGKSISDLTTGKRKLGENETTENYMEEETVSSSEGNFKKV
jgi:hypothetical protein